MKMHFGDIMMDDTGLDLSLFPRWDDSCIWRSVDSGILIFRITEQIAEEGPAEVFHAVQNIRLNREGKDTWTLCTGENTIETIVHTLQQSYEGDEKAIQNDVVTMVEKLHEEGYLLLEESPHPATRELDETATLTRNDDVISNVVEENFVIMNMKTSEVHSFGKHIEPLWDMCDSTHTVGDILSAAANTEETLFFLQFLVKLGLIKLKK